MMKLFCNKLTRSKTCKITNVEKEVAALIKRGHTDVHVGLDAASAIPFEQYKTIAEGISVESMPRLR